MADNPFTFDPSKPVMPDDEWDAYCAERDEQGRRELETEWLDRYVETIPERFKGSTLANYETPDPARVSAKQQVRAFIAGASKSGPGLFLTGPVGIGKSHLVVAASKALVQKGWRGRYLDVPAYLERLKASFDRSSTCPDPRRVSEGIDFLVLDALDIDAPNAWTQSTIYLLVDGAYANNTLIIVTSNFDYHELATPARLGERTGSRLVEVTQKIRPEIRDDWRKRIHKKQRDS